MLDMLSKKLHAILSVAPTAENETIIRELSQRFLSELRLYTGKDNDIEIKMAIAECHKHIEKLERNLILYKNPNSYLFFNTDINRLVGNCVIACDTLLTASNSVITFHSGIISDCICSPKLITKAVTLIVDEFVSRGGEIIEFNLKKTQSSTVLSAVCDNNNQVAVNLNFDDENMQILSKIANIHHGVCLYCTTNLNAYIQISISNGLKSKNSKYTAPSYIDLLLDKSSQIYIGMSKINEIHFRD